MQELLSSTELIMRNGNKYIWVGKKLKHNLNTLFILACFGEVVFLLELFPCMPHLI